MRSVRIGELLNRFLSDRGIDLQRGLEAAFDAWEAIIGLPEARLARPLSLEDGLLVLAVANPTVGSEVSFSQRVYLERLNAYFGAEVVREVRVRVLEGRPLKETAGGSVETTPGEDQRRFDPDAIELTANEQAWIDETAEPVRAPHARATLRRVLALHLKRQRWEATRQPTKAHEPP